MLYTLLIGNSSNQVFLNCIKVSRSELFVDFFFFLESGFLVLKAVTVVFSMINSQLLAISYNKNKTYLTKIEIIFRFYLKLNVFEASLPLLLVSTDSMASLNISPWGRCEGAIILTPTVWVLLVRFLVDLIQVLSVDTNLVLSQRDAGREDAMRHVALT